MEEINEKKRGRPKMLQEEKKRIITIAMSLNDVKNLEAVCEAKHMQKTQYIEMIIDKEYERLCQQEEKANQ